jgi:hypothetical protein
MCRRDECPPAEDGERRGDQQWAAPKPDAHRGDVDPPHGDYPFSRIRDKLLLIGGIVKQMPHLRLISSGDAFRFTT